MAAFLRGIGEASTAAEIGRRALTTLGELEGWSAGVVWLSNGAVSRCVEVWSAGDRPAPDLAHPSALVARAQAAGRVMYASDEDVRRDARAMREGFRGAMAA